MNEALQSWKPAIRITILLFICSISTLVRVFSVIRYESIIHEFDPWFNYRATKFLVANDFKEFWNFFDSESWYPLGRDVGSTVYPGLMVRSSIIVVNIWVHLHPAQQDWATHRHQEHLCVPCTNFCCLHIPERLPSHHGSHQATWSWTIRSSIHRTRAKLYVQVRSW